MQLSSKAFYETSNPSSYAIPLLPTPLQIVILHSANIDEKNKNGDEETMAGDEKKF